MFTSWLPFIASFLKSFIESSCWPSYALISPGMLGAGILVQIQAPMMMLPIRITNTIVKIEGLFKRIALVILTNTSKWWFVKVSTFNTNIEEKFCDIMKSS